MKAEYIKPESMVYAIHTSASMMSTSEIVINLDDLYEDEVDAGESLTRDYYNWNEENFRHTDLWDNDW